MQPIQLHSAESRVNFLVLLFLHVFSFSFPFFFFCCSPEWQPLFSVQTAWGPFFRRTFIVLWAPQLSCLSSSVQGARRNSPLYSSYVMALELTVTLRSPMVSPTVAWLFVWSGLKPSPGTAPPKCPIVLSVVSSPPLGKFTQSLAAAIIPSPGFSMTTAW